MLRRGLDYHWIEFWRQKYQLLATNFKIIINPCAYLEFIFSITQLSMKI